MKNERSKVGIKKRRQLGPTVPDGSVLNKAVDELPNKPDLNL